MARVSNQPSQLDPQSAGEAKDNIGSILLLIADIRRKLCRSSFRRLQIQTNLGGSHQNNNWAAR